MIVGCAKSFTVTDSVSICESHVHFLKELTGFDNFYAAKLDVIHKVQFLFSGHIVAATYRSSVSHIQGHHHLIGGIIVFTFVNGRNIL